MINTNPNLSALEIIRGRCIANVGLDEAALVVSLNDGSKLVFYNRTFVNGEPIDRKHRQQNDTLRSMLGLQIVGLEMRDGLFVIELSNGWRLSMSMADADWCGAEAMVLTSPDRPIVVVN